jgi:hypothetical protein
MAKVNETLASRKFWVTIIISALAVSLFISGHIDIERMLEIIRWAAGFYVGSLGIEDAAKRLIPLIKAG